MFCDARERKRLIQHNEGGCSLGWENRKLLLALDTQMAIIRGYQLLIGVVYLYFPCNNWKQTNKSWNFLSSFLPFLLSFLILCFLPFLLFSEVLTLGSVNYSKHCISSALIFPKNTTQIASPQSPGHFTPYLLFRH